MFNCDINILSRNLTCYFTDGKKKMTYLFVTLCVFRTYSLKLNLIIII